jgi:hypothetical protein
MRLSDRTLPAPLARAQAQIERWRETREAHRIPEEIWSEAVRLAERYGVNRTSCALRLNYYSLKDRLDASNGASEESSPTFVDLIPRPPVGTSAPSGGTGQGAAEWNDRSGATLRIQWQDGEGPDLAAVTAAFFGRSR